MYFYIFIYFTSGITKNVITQGQTVKEQKKIINASLNEKNVNGVIAIRKFLCKFINTNLIIVI